MKQFINLILIIILIHLKFINSKSIFFYSRKPTSDLMENPNLWTPYQESKNYLNISGSILDIEMKVSVDDSYFFDRMDFFSTNLSNYYFK